MQPFTKQTPAKPLCSRFAILLSCLLFACGVTRVRNPKADEPKEPDAVSVNYDEKFEQLKIVSEIRKLEANLDSKLGDQNQYAFHPFVSEAFLKLEKETIGYIYFCDTDILKIADIRVEYNNITSSEKSDLEKAREIQALEATYDENIRSYNARIKSCQKEYQANLDVALKFRGEYLAVCSVKTEAGPDAFNFKPIDFAKWNKENLKTDEEAERLHRIQQNQEAAGRNDPDLNEAIKQTDQKASEITKEEKGFSDRLDKAYQSRLKELKTKVNSAECQAKISKKPAYPGRQRTGEDN